MTICSGEPRSLIYLKPQETPGGDPGSPIPTLPPDGGSSRPPGVTGATSCYLGLHRSGQKRGSLCNGQDRGTPVCLMSPRGQSSQHMGWENTLPCKKLGTQSEIHQGPKEILQPTRTPHYKQSPVSAPCLQETGLRPKLWKEFLQLHSNASGEIIITGQDVKGYTVPHL